MQEEEKQDDDEDDFGQRLLDRRNNDTSHHSVGYRKQEKLNARPDSLVTSFGNFVKGSLKVTNSAVVTSSKQRQSR